MGRSRFAARYTWLVLSCWFVVASCLLASSRAASIYDPDYLIDTWTPEDGLPQGTVTSIAQTPDGYLWMGTFGGLVRWDGVKFTVFDEKNTPTLPNGNIANIRLDRSSRLWVSTRGTLLVSQGPNWTQFEKKAGWEGDYVRTFAEQGGTLCLTTFDGKVFTNQTDRLVQMPPPGGQNERGYQAYVDPAGHILVAQERYVGLWDGQQWRTPSYAGVITNRFRGIGTDRDGNLLVHTIPELLRMKGDRLLSRLPIPTGISYSWHLFESSENKVWVPTVERGLYCISTNGPVRRFTSDTGLTFDSMRCVYEDRERNLWVGSSGGGLMRFKPRRFLSLGAESGLQNRNVKAIVEQVQGRMIAGTHGGPLLSVESNQIQELAFTTEGDTARGLFVQCLLVDRQRNTWVGTYGRSLRIVNGNQARIIDHVETGGHSTSALYEDSQGRIWIGGDQTLAMFNGTQFQTIQQTNVRLAAIRSLAEDRPRGVLWALSSRGLFRQESGNWSEIKLPNGTPVARANGLFVASDGSVWVGRAGMGLWRWREGQWSELTDAQGLPEGSVSSIMEDDFGHWWLGSDRGVIRVAKNDLFNVADGLRRMVTCQVFTSRDGLPNTECAAGFQSVSAKDSLGRLWFATPKGLGMVDPRNFQVPTNALPVILESVAYRDRSGKLHEIVLPPDETTLRIPSGSRELEVHYTAVHLAAPEKVQFSYQLEGESANWVDADTRRTLYFHTLKPGPVSLRFRAANENGVWGQPSTPLRLEIQPFYWQTAWFRLLVLAGILAIGGGVAWRVAHNKLRRHLEEIERERLLEAERARLASIMDGTSDFVGFCDDAGVISYVNVAGRRMVGWSEAGPLEGRRIADCHPPAETQKVLHEALPAARRDGLWSGKMLFQRQDGSLVPTSQVIVAHRSDDGAVEFYSTIARDITEQERAAEEIRQLNTGLERKVEDRTSELRAITKDLEAFSYSVAHDLRAPLQNISGFAGLLRTSAGTLNPTSSRYLDVITTQVRRMASLIDDLLSFARVTKAELRKAPIDLNELVQQTRDSLGLERQQNKITWQIDPLPTVLADPGLLRQVLANLISNAAKYSRQRDPAVIQIGTAPSPNNEVVIFIQDNGAGFNMKYATKLFEAFHRLHSAEEFEGNGIGLANVQRILQRHGGRIWAEAEVDKGATFFFSLPT